MSSILIYVTAVAVAVVSLYGIGRAFGRRPEEEDPTFGPPPELRVLTRTSMGRGRQLVVVEVEGRRLLLGSTRSQWCALADLGRGSAQQEQEAFDSIDSELARAVNATRYRKGWKHS